MRSAKRQPCYRSQGQKLILKWVCRSLNVKLSDDSIIYLGPVTDFAVPRTGRVPISRHSDGDTLDVVLLCRLHHSRKLVKNPSGSHRAINVQQNASIIFLRPVHEILNYSSVLHLNVSTAIFDDPLRIYGPLPQQTQQQPFPGSFGCGLRFVGFLRLLFCPDSIVCCSGATFLAVVIS